MKKQKCLFAVILGVLIFGVFSQYITAQGIQKKKPTTTTKPLAKPMKATRQLKLKKISVPAALKQKLAKKPIYNAALVKTKLRYSSKQIPLLKIKGRQSKRTREVVLEKVSQEPSPAKTVTSPTLLKKLSKYQAHIAKAYYGPALQAGVLFPNVINHKTYQTGIRDQGGRGTCVAHAAVAAIEAIYKKNGTTKNLSENHAYNVFMAREGSTCTADPGLQTWKAAGYLTSDRICEESQSPYTSLSNCATIPSTCNANKRHGHISTSTFFAPDFGGTGDNIATNTNYLESLLRSGHDVIMGLYVAGTDWFDGSAETGVVDVQMSGGNPAAAYGGHAMLMVGYSKTGNYFEFKNSWGTDQGHGGYFRLTYEYLQTYAKYGYVVNTATTP
jgi:C1A family cysteine protease